MKKIKAFLKKLPSVIRFIIEFFINYAFIVVIYLIILHYVIYITNMMKFPGWFMGALQIGFALKLVEIIIPIYCIILKKSKI